MKKQMKKSLVCLAVLAITGCAAHTDEIQANYVSSTLYDNYSCEQLENEAYRIMRQVKEVGTRVNDTAERDGVQASVGIILFWPTLFFLEGKDTADTHKYAELKGHINAIEETSIRKNCRIRFL